MDSNVGDHGASSQRPVESIIGYQHQSPTTFAMEQEAAAAGDGFMFPVTAGGSPIQLPWQMIAPGQQQERFFPNVIPPSLPPLPPPAFYGDFYTRRASAAALTFAYDADPIGLAGLYMGPDALLRGGGLTSPSPFGDLGKMTAQEIMDAKALAASKSHSEAERRRRERINAHLAKLRSLLPSTTKTDKASLLAEVIQHVKELKRQTSEIAEESPLPTESDELTVDAANDEDGRLVVTASLCCDDRSDLLPELIKSLKALRLRTLKAEITTLGGRVKNVLVITADDRLDPDNSSSNHQKQQQQSLASIQDALKSVMERTSAASDEPSSAGIKRQRTANLLEHRSI